MTNHDQPAKGQSTEESAAQTGGMSTFWQRIRRLVASGFGSPSWFGSLRLWIGVLGAIVAAVALLWLVDNVIFYILARSYVDEVAIALDLNPHLANALILLTFVIAIFFVRFLWSFSRQRRIVGISGLAALLIAHSLVLWWATRDQIIGKCYVISRDGNVTYREHPGIDAKTGRECRPVTPEMVERLRDYQAGKRPQRVTVESPLFFDDRSGEPIVWYYRAKNNEIQLFDLMGFHPDTGDELIPISKEVVSEWQDQHKPPQPPPLTPKRIDPNTFVFFDPLNGEPRAWYWKASDGTYEFYDGPGFQPQTGDALKIATRDIVDAWTHPSAPTTPRVPNRIDPNTFVFFDPLNGEPRAWYWKTTDGNYEFYDGPGFQPQTGDKLAIVTREVVNAWKDQQKTPTTPPRVPNRVQVVPDTVFFDPVTGNPRLWYWQNDKGEYEFFDGPGFHPQNGQPLQSFSKDMLNQYQQEIDEKAKRLKAEQDRIEAEQKARQEAENRRQLELQKKAEEEQRQREAAAQAAQKCDDLAANPTDANRVGAGISYGDLKPLAAEAAAACDAASKQNPNILRFQYQLARALSLTGDGIARAKNKQRALEILQALVKAGYPAAYDNLGSLYRDRGDLGNAAALFRRGIALNDSDSMISLADLIGDYRVMPQSPEETPPELYRRAADLGNQIGVRWLQQQAQQIQQQQNALQFMGTILKNIR